MEPAQQVGSTPELIDKIYSYMDLKTAFRARVVCRQWRSLSEMDLKRRMTIRNLKQGGLTEAITVAVYQQLQKGTNLTNKFRVSARKLTLTTYDNKGTFIDYRRRGPHWRHSSAPFVAIVLDQDWTSAIESLKLYRCLTVVDLVVCQVTILKCFKSAKSIYVKLLKDRSNVVPLCYAELQEKSGQEDFRNVSLKRFEVRGWLRSFTNKKAGSLDCLAYDLFATCPNLDTFKFGLFQIRDHDDDLVGYNPVEPDSYFREDMWAEGDGIETDLDFTITRSNHPNRILDVAEVKPYWTARLIVCHRNLGPALCSLMRAILSLTQLQKLWISMKNSVFKEVLRRTDWLQSRLDVLYLTTGYGCPLVLKALDLSTVFTNVTRLYWSIDMIDAKTFNLDFSAGDRPTFPNVVTLQLHRDRRRMYIDYERREGEFGGRESDVWISRNIHKMAPNVRRLIVDVFEGTELGTDMAYWNRERYTSPKDIPLMLEVAKGFDQLQDLVMINPYNVLKFWTGFAPEKAALCLNGLKSLTLSIYGYEMLMSAAKYFLQVCQQKSLASLTKLGLYNRADDDSMSDNDLDSDDEDMDGDDIIARLLRRGKVAIPEHMIVTSGRWTREMAKEAFQGPVI